MLIRHSRAARSVSVAAVWRAAPTILGSDARTSTMVEVNLSSARRSAGTPRCRRRAAGARGRTSSASPLRPPRPRRRPTRRARARRGRRRTQRGRAHRPRARVHRGRERSEALDLHHRRPTGPGLLVLGRSVDVDERLQPRVCRGELGSASRAASSSVSTRHRSNSVCARQRAGVEELGDARGQARAVGGGERLGMAARHRQRHLERRVRPDLPHHAAEERRVQQRQVDGADRAPPPRARPRRPDPSRCPAAARGRPPGRPRPARAAAGRAAPAPAPAPRGRARRPPGRRTPTVRCSSVDPCHSSARLGAAHPYRAAADEDDAGHEWATVGHPMVVRDCRGRQPVRARVTGDTAQTGLRKRTGGYRTSAGCRPAGRARAERARARMSEGRLSHDATPTARPQCRDRGRLGLHGAVERAARV